MAGRTAFVTGATGQDGAWLTALLLDKGYVVHGLRRQTSIASTARLDRILAERPGAEERLHLHYGDMCDDGSLIRLIDVLVPDEIYNLAGQTHVQVSFDTARHTADVNALGALRILEAIRVLGLRNRVRLFQASTSEMFGRASETPQRETTHFQPRSPYAAAKLYAHWMTANYREAYGLHASSGILFNHESPFRAGTFVTRKITRAAAAIKLGLADDVRLGNLDARRDWGHARDYVEGMWLMLQQETPDDYVFATGENRSVRELVERAFAEVGIPIVWSGSGPHERGLHAETNAPLVRIDPRFYRPTEVDALRGDASKAREKLGWAPRTTFDELVAEMVAHDLADLAKTAR